jgi:hypothetical protein
VTEVTNVDLLGVLLDIKEDVGSLKTSASTNLLALQSHSARLGELEAGANKQKGALKVWGLVGAGVGSTIAAIVATFVGKH